MGRIGYTYGSEWHLLRYLGYHRNELNRRIEDVIPGEAKVINWVDFHFREQPVPYLQPPVVTATPRILDAERTGHDFLEPGRFQHIPPEWRDYFRPNQSGDGPQHWDAVAELNVGGDPYWLLVEAKAHLGELNSTFQGGAAAKARIQAAFNQVKADWNHVPIEDWFGPYYQFCNRLASLHFLRQNSIKVKLLFIYFMGDRHPPGRQVTCPADEPGWLVRIQQMEQHVGFLSLNNPLAQDVHKLFLPVCPAGIP